MSTRNSRDINLTRSNRKGVLTLFLCLYLVASAPFGSVVAQDTPPVMIGDSYNFISQTSSSYTSVSPATNSSKSQTVVYNELRNSSQSFNISGITNTKILALYPNFQRFSYDYSVSSVVDRFLSQFLAIHTYLSIPGVPSSIFLYSPLVTFNNPELLFVRPDWVAIAGELSQRLNAGFILKGQYFNLTLGNLTNSVNSFDLFGAKSISQLAQKLRGLVNFYRYAFNYTVHSSNIENRSFVFELKYSDKGILEYMSTVETVSFEVQGNKVLRVNSVVLSLGKSVNTANPVPNPIFSSLTFFGITLLNLLILITILWSLKRKTKVVEVGVEDIR